MSERMIAHHGLKAALCGSLTLAAAAILFGWSGFIVVLLIFATMNQFAKMAAGHVLYTARGDNG